MVATVTVSNLLFQSCQVTLNTLVFTLQGLHAGKVTPIVVGRQHSIFLLDPGDGLISISTDGKERKKSISTKQLQNLSQGVTSINTKQSKPYTTPNHTNSKIKRQREFKRLTGVFECDHKVLKLFPRI